MAQRKRRRSGGRTAQPDQVHPDAAGLDIGAEAVFAAVREDRASPAIRNFPTFTTDLHALADWFQECQVTTVAMESTGVYWIPVFQILEARGFDVVLVNAHHVRSVPGRKSDVADCEWLRYLHSAGLLRGSFRPPDEVCALRSLLRHRENLVRTAARSVLHMQKSYDHMNVHLHHVISDLTGVTGLTITDAILDGEHNPVLLATLANRRIKATPGAVRPEAERRRQHRQQRGGQGAQRHQRRIGIQALAAGAQREVAAGEVLRQQADNLLQHLPHQAQAAAQPAQGAGQLDVVAQAVGGLLPTRRPLGAHDGLLQLLQRSGQPRRQAVRQQAEGGVTLRAVPARDQRAGRLPALVGAVAGKRATAGFGMIGAPVEPCITPRFGGNVLLAGEPRLVAKLHRSRPGGWLPARASFLLKG